MVRRFWLKGGREGMRCVQGERRRGANGFNVDMGWGWQRGVTSRRRRRGRGKEARAPAAATATVHCYSCLPVVEAGRPRHYWSCAARRYVMRARHDGTCGLLQWMETPTACTGGRCMRWRDLAIGRGHGDRGMGSCPHITKTSTISQCQRRTCGINLEPMQCRVRGRQSLNGNGKRRRDGPHTGSQIRVAGSARSREQGASSRELAGTYSRRCGLTVGLTVQAGFPRYLLYCITHKRVLGTAHMPFGPEYPICPSAVRSIDLPMWALRFDKAALAY